MGAKDDAAAARRRLCSRSVVDEVLDDREGVPDVLTSLENVWKSSAVRGSRPESIGLVVGFRGEGKVADALSSMTRRWDDAVDVGTGRGRREEVVTSWTRG